jgi:hypothetical protein
VKEVGQFLPAGVPFGVGLDDPGARIVAGVPSEDIDVAAIGDSCAGSSRVLHRRHSLPLFSDEVIALAGREQSVFVRAVLSTSDCKEKVFVEKSDVCVAGVDHIW